MIDNRFKNKVFVITGAAGGIGFATARRAALEGAKLVLADRKNEMSKCAFDKLQKITSEVTFLILDLTSEENCKNLIHTALDKYGRIDVLINNAGITGLPAPVHSMTTQMFMDVMACNIYSAFFCSHYALSHMISQSGHSCVVNVSSVAGLTGFPGHSAYVTSKHALSGLTKNMAMDYAKYGIRVNAVNPGTTDTPMYQEALAFLSKKKADEKEASIDSSKAVCPPKIVSAQARVATAEEVSNVILFLASDEASNMTGTTIPVDGGFVCY